MIILLSVPELKGIKHYVIKRMVSVSMYRRLCSSFLNEDEHDIGIDYFCVRWLLVGNLVGKTDYHDKGINVRGYVNVYGSHT